MKFSKLGGAAAIVAMALGLGVAAWAQSYPPPQVTNIGPTDLIQIIVGGRGSAQNVYATGALVTAQKGYYKSIPLTGFTYTFGNAATSLAVFNPAGTLSTGAITLAASPNDGEDACFFSTGAVSTLTLAANTGQSINNAVTAATANVRYCYLYSASNSTWDRSN